MRQVLVKRLLHMQYRVPVLCMPLQQPVPVAIYRCAVVIQAIVFNCHMQNNWKNRNSTNRGNGAAVQLTSILAWNLHGNFSMRVKLKAMPVVLWICTTIEPDERYVWIERCLDMKTLVKCRTFYALFEEFSLFCFDKAKGRENKRERERNRGKEKEIGRKSKKEGERSKRRQKERKK